VTINRFAAALVAVALLAAGAGAYVIFRRAAPGGDADAGGSQPVQTAKIVATAQGFEPSKITLRAGTPARLTFVRTEAKTCATEVLFPALKIARDLPLNEAVVIEFTPEKTGEITFACGMNMMQGTVVVQ
jgi:plastocyanin domain-containing protein